MFNYQIYSIGCIVISYLSIWLFDGGIMFGWKKAVSGTKLLMFSYQIYSIFFLNSTLEKIPVR